MIGGGPVAAPVVFVRDRERAHRCSRRSARDHHAMRVMVALQSMMARTATRPRDRSETWPLDAVRLNSSQALCKTEEPTPY